MKPSDLTLRLIRYELGNRVANIIQFFDGPEGTLNQLEKARKKIKHFGE